MEKRNRTVRQRQQAGTASSVRLTHAAPISSRCFPHPRPLTHVLLLFSHFQLVTDFDMKQKKPLSHQSNLRIFAANSCVNPLQEIDAKWHKFDNGSDLSATISCRHSKDVTDAEFEWMTGLTEENMRHHYEQSENGWNRKQKEKEFRHETARLLFVHKSTAGSGDAPAIAFVHLRFELDDEEKHPALYCYEIHVKKEFQSKGLGKHLMDLLRDMGSRFKMYKVMLTCFKHNEATLHWYQKLGYTPDVCSPEKSGESVSYFILSSKIGHK